MSRSKTGQKCFFLTVNPEPALDFMPAFVGTLKSQIASTRVIMKLAQKTVTTNPIAVAKEAFLAVRQYQRDWQRHGVDRVRLYYDDVDGNWLDEFDQD
jgi:hypothetical protein